MVREVLNASTERMTIDIEDEPVSPSVVAIFVSPAKDEDMQEKDFVRAFAGEGLEGDRYRIGTEAGTYSHHGIPEDWRNITLISQQGIDETNAKLADPFAYS